MRIGDAAMTTACGVITVFSLIGDVADQGGKRSLATAMAVLRRGRFSDRPADKSNETSPAGALLGGGLGPASSGTPASALDHYAHSKTISLNNHFKKSRPFANAEELF